MNNRQNISNTQKTPWEEGFGKKFILKWLVLCPLGFLSFSFFCIIFWKSLLPMSKITMLVKIKPKGQGSVKIKFISKTKTIQDIKSFFSFFCCGGKGGLKPNKQKVLQPRKGLSWVGMSGTRPLRDGTRAEQSPAPVWGDSQSQCSVRVLPWCPSLPGRLRQSNTVGYSMHGHLQGVDHEMKHQKKRPPFSKSLGGEHSILDTEDCRGERYIS